MRFLLNVVDTATGTATVAEMAAIDEFNAGLVERGQLVLAAGLAAPQQSVVLDNRAGAGLTMDGPLHAEEEYVSGFWIIEAQDRAEALALAAQASEACHRRIELRPFL